MNILVVCHSGLYQDLTASFVHNQVREYAALGHQVRVIIPLPFGKQLPFPSAEGGPLLKRGAADGVELFYLRFLSLSNFGKRRFNTPSAIAAVRLHLSSILKGFVPDVIHAHTLGLDSSIGAWLKERLGCPLVVTTHGSDTSVPVEQGRAAELKPLCSGADRVAAVSSALADKLRTCGTETPISVILNGFQPSALPAGIQKTPLSFIQVGHLLEQKRFHITLQAFAAIRKQYPGASLTIIGQGPDQGRLKTLCEALGVTASVRFLGQIPNSAVMEEMSRHQFFVMPSINEGFGIVYLEAMANGCVTVGTEGEGIADLIVSGENGFLVPPDDPDAIVRAVEWCLAHPEEASAMAERGRKDAVGLTWGKNAAQYIELFQSLTEGKDRNV